MMRIRLAAPLTLLLALPVPVALVRQQSAPHGVERVYYIAAEEVIWNYAPAGTNLTGRPVPENEAAEAQTIKSYRKAIYREYTDDTFRIARPRSRQWEHLGILGPLIRAEVGDTVRVVFLNRTKLFCSVHPHGLAYRKESEGALYNDGTSGADRADDLIPPDKVHTFVWT